MSGKTYQKVLLDKKAEFLEALGSNCQELVEAGDRLGADADKIAHDDFVLLQVNESLYSQLRQVEDALKKTAYKYTDGAAYENGALGTTSFDKGYGLVDVVAAAQQVR